MAINDEINETEKSILEQLRVYEQESAKLNTLIRGRLRIESEIEKYQRGIETLEEKKLAAEEEIAKLTEMAANKKNNQRRRAVLNERLQQKEAEYQRSIVSNLQKLNAAVSQRRQRLANIDDLAGEIETRRALTGGNVSALEEIRGTLQKEANDQMEEEYRQYVERERQKEEAHKKSLRIQSLTDQHDRDRQKQMEEDMLAEARLYDQAYEIDKKRREKKAKEEQKLLEQKKKDEEDAAKKQKAFLSSLTKAALGVVTAFGQMVAEGINFARQIGSSRTTGVATDMGNRFAAAFQLASANEFASREQIASAQRSMAGAFGGPSAGRQFGSVASREFAQALNRGFGTQFDMTEESFRNLALSGMRTSAEFEDFRRSTGLAALSAARFDRLYSKNFVSFMLYGNQFAKAAEKAEKLGISLSSVQSAQESMVTGLDNTLDTVAQLNQLGANVDFATLTRINEFGSPEETAQYIAQNIPRNILMGASGRALAGQFGISVQDILKLQEESTKNLTGNMEDQLTKMAEPAGMFNSAVTQITVRMGDLKSSFGGLAAAVTALTGVLLANTALNALGPLGSLAKVLGVGAIGLGAYSMMKADDMVSSGYGDRTLVTPKGSIALNNSDTVVAGTNLGQGSGGNQELMRRIDQLISKLDSASTVINVGGERQKVSRLTLVGVNSRYEVE